MKHVAAGLSDTGRQRDHNEDALLIDAKMGLYIVCDGVGGHAAGEVASGAACQVVRGYLIDHQDALRAYALDANPANRSRAVAVVEEALRAANLHVRDLAAADPDRHGMSTTLAMMLMLGGQAILAHVGDSRIYLSRRGELYQLTDDHSLVAERVRKGELTPQQAAESPDAGVITRAIGQYDFVEPETLTVELMSDDRFLLCTDGLTTYLAGDELNGVLLNTSLKKLPQSLIDLANKRGGRDNITVIAVDISGAPPESDLRIARKLDVLRRIPLFEHLTYQELMKALQIMRLETFEAGETIIHEGDSDDRLFISLNGVVDVVKQRQVIATLEPGSFFGEMSLVDRGPRSASVIARQACRLLVIFREDFFRLLNREPRVAVKVLWSMWRVLNQRLRLTSEELAWLKSIAPGGPDADDLPVFFDETR